MPKPAPFGAEPMASLFNRDGNFYAQFNDSARSPAQRRLSLRTRDPKLAAKFLADAEAAYREGRFDPWVQTLAALEPVRPAEPLTVSEAIDRFLIERADSYRPLTLSNYRSVLDRLAGIVGPSVPLARLTVSDLSSYALSPNAARGTRSTRIGTLSALFAWAKESGVVTDNLAKQIKRPKKQGLAHSIVKKAVTEAELDRICEAVREDDARRQASDNPSERCGRLWMASAFRFAFYTGLRASEISRLTWDAVDMDAGTIAITEQKNGGADVLPLAPPAIAVLRDLAEDVCEGYVFRSAWQRKAVRDHRAFSVNLNRELTTYRDLAGITRPVTFHGLRHGFASHLALKGKSAFVIRQACRHASVTTSQIYVSLSARALSDELSDAFA